MSVMWSRRRARVGSFMMNMKVEFFFITLVITYGIFVVHSSWPKKSCGC